MNLIYSEINNKTVSGKESRRLFHGRGHNFPGYEDLVIDWFDPVVLVTLYCQRDEVWLDQLVVLLRSQLVDIQAIILQERYLRNSPSRILFGDLTMEVNAVEAGMKYRLRLNGAQNIGFFPDMAQGRELVKKIAAKKKILNLFSYSCSFSVAALSGGATQVVNLDMNQGALDLGRLNHQLNGLDLRRVSFLSMEIFRSFSRLRKLSPFDLVICDPPGEQGDSFKPQRHWPKLIQKLPDLVKTGGEILICLSSPHLLPAYIQHLFLEFCPQSELLEIYYPGADFPENDKNKGLKILRYQIN